jgi:hypothetical protein
MFTLTPGVIALSIGLAQAHKLWFPKADSKQTWLVAFGGVLLGMLLDYYVPESAIALVQAFEYSFGLTGGVGLTKDLAKKIGGQ